MKVRIIKCSNKNWWYNDKIGEIFDVLMEEEDDYDDYVVANYVSNKNSIDKADCEIVEDCKYAKVECNDCSSECDQVPDVEKKVETKIKVEDYLKTIRLNDGLNTIYLDKTNNGKSFCIRPKDSSSFKFEGGYNSLKVWRNIAELILKAVEICEKGE